MEGWTGYESHAYKDKPGDFKYLDLQVFYEKWSKESGNRRIPKFETSLKKKVIAEARNVE